MISLYSCSVYVTTSILLLNFEKWYTSSYSSTLAQCLSLNLSEQGWAGLVNFVQTQGSTRWSLFAMAYKILAKSFLVAVPPSASLPPSPPSWPSFGALFSPYYSSYNLLSSSSVMRANTSLLIWAGLYIFLSLSYCCFKNLLRAISSPRSFWNFWRSKIPLTSPPVAMYFKWFGII